jgi:hypothetical protein
MKDELAKRFIAAAQQYEREVKEAAKELDEEYRGKMEDLGDAVLDSTKKIVTIVNVLDAMDILVGKAEKGGGE